MSLADIIGRLPNGATALLSDDDVAAYLRKHYATTEESRRKYRARRRELFYRDAGDEFIVDDIRSYFSDETVRKLREKFVETSKYNNVTKRLTNEISTVYSRPARRELANERDNETYQSILSHLRMDLFMRSVNRCMNLNQQCLIVVRVRTRPDGAREPVLDVVTPSAFSAIAHPFDAGLPVGYIIDHGFRLVSNGLKAEDTPSHIVWDDEEFFKTNTSGNFIAGSKVKHGLGRMPIVLVSESVNSDRILDDTEGEDLIAGHRAVWLQNVLGLKESKSVNNQTAFIGDMGRVPTGQTSDTESDLILGEDVTTQTIDRGVDLAQFRDQADHILERLAANRGIPPSVLRHEGATSGFEIELRRIGIREIRRAQEVTFRAVERELVSVMAMVFARDLPEFAFDPTGWTINFGEVETPLSDKERLDVFEQERRLGVSNTLELIKERDPDLTSDKEASEVLQHNIEVETMRNLEMRMLQQLSGSMGADVPDGAATPRVAVEPQGAEAPQGAVKGADVLQGAETEKAADTSLNGAQVTAMIDISRAVGVGEISRDSGIEMMITAFPVTREQAEKLVGSKAENAATKAAAAAKDDQDL